MSLTILLRAAVAVSAAAVLAGGALDAQETKPIPKDSMRVRIPGCTKGYIFTAGPRTLDEPGSFEIREGMHLRMNGPKKLISEIKAHEGSMIEIVGLVKKGQYREGVDIGKGVRVSPGGGSSGGIGAGVNLGPSGQVLIDVESWRQVDGACRSR